VVVVESARTGIEREKAPLGVTAEPPRQSARKSFGPRAELLRHERKIHPPETLVPNGRAVPRIAEKKLVGAFARQHDLDVLARQSRDEIERHAGGVRDRLVLVADEIRQRGEKFPRPEDDLAGLRAHGLPGP